MQANRSQRTELCMRHIDQFRVVFRGIDMQLKPGLRPQACRNDLAPYSGEDASRHVPAMAREQSSHDCSFPRRAEGRRKAANSRFTQLLHLCNRAADLCPLNQKIMQSIINLIDLVSEILKRFTRFSHMRAICGLRLPFGSHAPKFGFIDKAHTEKIKALREGSL